MMKKMMCTNPDLGLLFIRFGVGLLFLVHGVQKFMDIDGTAAAFSAAFGLSAIFAWLAAIIETAGGLMLILGVCTRFAGWMLAALMVVIIFILGLDKGYVGGHEYHIILLLTTAGLALIGSGKHALKPCKK